MNPEQIVDQIWNGIGEPDNEKEQEDDDQCH